MAARTARAVVGDRDPDRSRFDPRRQVGTRCRAGVLDHVGESFLDDPEHREPADGVEAGDRAVDVRVDHDARDPSPADGRRERG
ncbi:MAG: hypothetical protein LC635_01535, partial [Pseudonocardiaceae bacterium]|nr:hypothetical protein [Pseudonocardiaceae bacterium]